MGVAKSIRPAQTPVPAEKRIRAFAPERGRDPLIPFSPSDDGVSLARWLRSATFVYIGWEEVWRIDDFEPDPVTAQTLLIGALGSYHGKLYWGTMQVPLSGALAHYSAYPPMGIPSPTDIVTTVLNTSRPISVFRCCISGRKTNFAGAVQLLYGDSLLEVFNPMSGWQLPPNAMNAEASFGPSGFGNPFNTYTWAMATYRNALYVGTFDWSFVANPMNLETDSSQPTGGFELRLLH